MKRLNSDSALILKSSHAANCGMRSFIASHFLNASLIAGLRASTTLVTSPNERCEASSAASADRNDKISKSKRVVVFIDPERRLCGRRAPKLGHHRRQRPCVKKATCQRARTPG